MQFEVEKKFWIKDGDNVLAQVNELGIELCQPIEQIDKYFSHPKRDFEKTDEALRLRTIGSKNFITYKGARIDDTTKTRRELELPLLDGSQHCNDFVELLTLLGFEPLMTVRKLRRKGDYTWQDFAVEICVDEIDQLGQFIELEITSDLKTLEQTKIALLSLADRLQLARPEKRSYLELLMSQLGPQQVG